MMASVLIVVTGVNSGKSVFRFDKLDRGSVERLQELVGEVLFAVDTERALC